MTRRDRSPLFQLTLARIRGFFREPSAVFWTFAFPVLLTIALGIAFRARPPEPVRTAVEAGPGADALRAALAAGRDVRIEVLPPGEARAALRALPGVRAARPDGAGWALTVDRAHVAVPALLQLLEARAIPLGALSTHRATLEDVFVTLTGRRLRD